MVVRRGFDFRGGNDEFLGALVRHKVRETPAACGLAGFTKASRDLFVD